MSAAIFESDTPAHIVDNLGLLASKAIGPTATRGQLYGIAAAVGKGKSFHQHELMSSRRIYRDLYFPKYHRQFWW